MNSNIDLSVIIPYSEQSLRFEPVENIYKIYKQTLDSTGLHYEFIFVINGRFDILEDIYQTVCGLVERGEKIRIIKLAKSFGEGTALSIAFENSYGDKILTLPPYEQIVPDEIPKLIVALEDVDMIVARRSPRIDSWINRVQSQIFHYLIRFRGDFRFHDLGCSVRVFKRRILDKVLIYGEQHRFFPILVHRYGYRVTEVPVTQSRKDDFQRFYPLATYLRRFTDIISVFFLVKFTKKPLRFFGILGLFTFFLGVLLAGYLFVERMFMGVALADRPLLLFDLLLFVISVQLFAIGLIGEIIIFTHAKDLKDYTIEKIIN
jgi:glycosyltransferase involved in cell wall biosynthesis